jgi:hypothetical protein
MSVAVSSLVPEAVYVVLHMANGPGRAEVEAGARVIVEAGQAPFRITDDMWMERFDKELGHKIEVACSPAHYNISDAGYDRHLYAFVRKVPSGETDQHRRPVLCPDVSLRRSKLSRRGRALFRREP